MYYYMTSTLLSTILELPSYDQKKVFKLIKCVDSSFKPQKNYFENMPIYVTQILVLYLNHVDKEKTQIDDQESSFTKKLDAV